ncbi:ATP-dependent Clp protease ATP-binding subunit ClpA, partial [hydrothermal vent metagenome]
DLFNILLQVMDHGALTDHNGKKVDFRNVILIMTTNAGASEMAKEAIGFGSTKRQGDDEEAIKRLFTPEFRNRLDAVIPFAGLDLDIIRRVVEKFVIELEAQLDDRNVTISLTEAATDWLAREGYDEKFGARPLARVIQEHIKKPLADEVLFGRLRRGGSVKVLTEEKDGGKTGLGFEIEEPEARKPRPKKPARPKAAKAPRKAPKKRTPKKGDNGGKGGGSVPKVPLLVD